MNWLYCLPFPEDKTKNMKHKIRNIFSQGAITPAFIADSIAKHATKTEIGGHSIFLGQVRADRIQDQAVRSITYSSYEEMANQLMSEIREEAFRRFDLTCMHVHHSLGEVKAGEICLFVFTSSPHRASACDACRWVVEEIKAKMPIWGKEILDEGTTIWKKENDITMNHG